VRYLVRLAEKTSASKQDIPSQKRLSEAVSVSELGPHNDLRIRLKNAETYEEWLDAAKQLDEKLVSTDYMPSSSS
jgi:hypothetical protein